MVYFALFMAAIGCVGGNFLFEIVEHRYRWDIARDHSYFQSVAIAIAAYNVWLLAR